MSRKSRRNRPETETVAAPPGAKRRRSILVGAVIALVFAVAAAVLLGRSGDRAPSAGDSPAALASIGSPSLGEPTAKVHIVEFIDPACETCALFFPLVKRVMAANPGRIRLSIRHVAFHEGADYAVRLLEASREQDLYWQTLERLLATQAEWAPHHTVQPALVDAAIVDLGLDLERLRSDMDSPEVARRVQQDRDDAIAMKVTATPEYFVNGRPLPSFGHQQLLALIDEQLQRAYAPVK